MIRKFMIALSIVGLTSAATPVLTPASVSAAQFAAGDKCSSNFLLFPTWDRGLERKGDTCEIEMSKDADGNPDFQAFIFIIVLNVIDIALRLVGYAAVGFIIYGGFKYLTSAGSADRITAGRKIIQNALIGLVISFFSVAIVNLIASNIK